MNLSDQIVKTGSILTVLTKYRNRIKNTYDTGSGASATHRNKIESVSEVITHIEQVYQDLINKYIQEWNATSIGNENGADIFSTLRYLNVDSSSNLTAEDINEIIYAEINT